MLLPGAGQLYAGARRRGLVLLGADARLLLLGARRARRRLAHRRRRPALVAVRARGRPRAARAPLSSRSSTPGGAARIGLAVLVALTAAPHVAAGYVTVRGYSVLESVFADEEPGDVMRDRGLFFTELPPLPRYVAPDTWQLALVERLGPGEVAPLERSARVLADAKPNDAKPWTTILLLGTDEGPGNFGARTDTIILAAVQHGTGRAAAFGIPRNLAQVPLGRKRKLLEGAAQRPLRR